MSDERFIFTCSTGRAGQESFSDWLARASAGTYVAFEEPQVNPVLPGPLGRIERRFRRRYVETDELLGRGKVLDAYAGGDDGYLTIVARRRLAMARRAMRNRRAHTYIDVSSHFIKGLHVGFTAELPRLSLVLLVRDPLLTMRSYLNRAKDFWLDNGRPDAARNELRLDPALLSPGELYLWVWCEVYLRYATLRDHPKVGVAVEVRTEHLSDATQLEAILATLKLAPTPAAAPRVMNSNLAQRRAATAISAEDVATFRRFVDRLPPVIYDRIAYFRDYDPARHLAAA